MIAYIISNWRLILSLVALFILTVFLGIRSCNQTIQEYENENIEIIDIDPPLPSDYDANCLRLTGKPCPKISK